MSDPAQRAWQFYLDDMIGFAEKVIAYADGLDQAGFIASELHYAHKLQEEALVIAREVGDRRNENRILIALGEISILQDEQEAAVDYLELSVSIARQIEDRQGEKLASWNLGLAYERQGDLANAAEQMQVRVDYEREIGHLKAEEHSARLAQVRTQLEAGSMEAYRR